MLELLGRSIEEAQGTIAASEETIKDEKRNWNLS